jgi:hypothetical protein
MPRGSLWADGSKQHPVDAHRGYDVDDDADVDASAAATAIRFKQAL